VRVQVRRKTGGRPPIRDFGMWRGATALLPVLREIGVEPEPLLREAGLSGQAFSHPDSVVPFAALCRALRLAIDRTGLTDDGIAMLGYEVPDPGIAGSEQMSFGALAIAANILRAPCGPGFELMAVTFACRSPADSGLFRRFFDAPVRFDAERSALAVDARWLQEPIKGADAYIRELLGATLKDAVAERGETLEGRVQRAVRTLLASGGCARKTPPEPPA
jgi:hypothetical protein